MKIKPGRTFPYYLKDQSGDDDPLIVDVFVLSSDAEGQVSDLTNQYTATTDRSERTSLLKQMAQLCSPEDITSVLSSRECWDVIGAAITGASLTVEERKKLGSQHT